MIFEFFLNIIKDILMFIFGLFPDFPPAPPEISGIVAFINGFLGEGIGVLMYMLGDLYFITLTLVVVWLNFDNIYRFAMWIIKKIPFLGGSFND